MRKFSYIIIYDSKAFALTGRIADGYLYPGRCPGLGASALSGRKEKNLRKSYNLEINS